MQRAYCDVVFKLSSSVLMYSCLISDLLHGFVSFPGLCHTVLICYAFLGEGGYVFGYMLMAIW